MGFRCSIHTSASIAFERSRYALLNAEKSLKNIIVRPNGDRGSVGIFLVENLSVVLQVSYFKYTKKKYGEGKRIFLMSPLHHHYQKKGMHESKIVNRFWIVAIMLAVLTMVTLKLR